jgi:hypothetical protein
MSYIDGRSTFCIKFEYIYDFNCIESNPKIRIYTAFIKF